MVPWVWVRRTREARGERGSPEELTNEVLELEQEHAAEEVREERRVLQERKRIPKKI